MSHQSDSGLLVSFVLVTCIWFTGCSNGGAQESYDVVIQNGRVMDPETNFDAVRNVGIKDGVIVTITEESLTGARVIDATGHVVAPGFIDTHTHGLDPFSQKVYARDGVTSAMDTELGTLDFKRFFEEHDGYSIINYGSNASHEYARMKVLDGINPTESTFVYVHRAEAEAANGSQWVTKQLDDEEMQAVLRELDQALADGAIGIATTVGYFKAAATTEEVYNVQKLANKWGRLFGAHARMGPHDPAPNEYTMGPKEVAANAVSLGSSLVVNHINFHGWQETHEMITGIRNQTGLPIWSEQYPWVAGGPSAGASITSIENIKLWGFTVEDTVLDPETGEYLSEAEYAAMRENDPGKNLIVFTRPKEWPAQLVAQEELAIVNDCLASFDEKKGKSIPQFYPEYNDILDYDYKYEDWQGHPRCAGTRGRSFRLARENDVPLMQVINNASSFPAKMLTQAGVEFFAKRGKIQEGMVADITIFDPETVQENSDYLPGLNGLPTTGIPYVLVSGSVVVDDSKVVTTNFPGRPIRFDAESPKM